MRWLLILLATSWPLFLQAAPETARDWLLRMQDAFKQLNYDGRFVYIHEGRVESLRILHSVSEGHERERLINLNGVAREVFRDNDEVFCVYPDEQSVVIDERGPKNFFPTSSFAKLASLETIYAFSLAGSERVAEREAQRIEVTSRDPYRYGYRLWLDKASGLLLRSQLVNEDDEVIEEILFTSLAVLDSLPEALVQPNQVSQHYVRHNRSAESQQMTEWQVGWVPQGFDLQMATLRNSPSSQQPVNYLLYADGLASISVFVEAMDEDGAVESGVMRMGGTSVYAHSYQGHLVTVLGEVPPLTVQKVAEAIIYRPNP